MSEHPLDQTTFGDEPDDFFGAECLSADELRGFVRATLSVEEEARVESHVAECALCAAELDAHYAAGELAAEPAAAQSEVARVTPHPVLVERFAAALRELRVPVPEGLRFAQGYALSAAPAEQVGSADGGRVRWRAEQLGEMFRVEITTSGRELAGLRLEVSIDGILVSGTGELPHVPLLPMGDGLRAELFVRQESLAAKRSELAARASAWALGFRPSSGE
jgi:hypothetical protein